MRGPQLVSAHGALQMIVRCKGAGRVMLVSDAASCAGLQPGPVPWGGRELLLEAGPSGHVVRDPANGCLAGSGATLKQCVAHLSSLGIVGEAEVQRMAFDVPLRFLGLNPADFVAGAPRAVGLTPMGAGEGTGGGRDPRKRAR